MSKISPKLIDVENNRIETDDNLFRKVSQYDIDVPRVADRVGSIVASKYTTKLQTDYDENGRFPTQLFTNIKNDKFKYIKNI